MGRKPLFPRDKDGIDPEEIFAAITFDPFAGICEDKIRIGFNEIRHAQARIDQMFEIVDVSQPRDRGRQIIRLSRLSNHVERFVEPLAIHYRPRQYRSSI